MRTRDARVAVSLLAASLGVASCSIAPPFGRHDLLVGGLIRDDARQIERRMIPGVDVRLRGGWEGLGLGWSDVTVASPRLPEGDDGTPSDPPETPFRYAPPLGLHRLNAHGQDVWIGWVAVEHRTPGKEVHFVRSTEVGLAFHWSRSAVGLALGLQRGTTLVVHPAVDGAFLMRCGHRTDWIPCDLSEVDVGRGASHDAPPDLRADPDTQANEESVE